MTATDVSKLTHRELDALITDKVMGWTVAPHEPEEIHQRFLVAGKRVFAPFYSTDRNAAALVVEKLVDLGLHLRLATAIWEMCPGSKSAVWFALTITPHQLMEACLLAWEQSQ